VEAGSPRTRAHTSALSSQRIELITRAERRRRWSAEQKPAIVAESYAPKSSALETARKYGMSVWAPRSPICLAKTGSHCPGPHQHGPSLQAAAAALVGHPIRVAGVAGRSAEEVARECEPTAK
jgi:hypothetical protein